MSADDTSDLPLPRDTTALFGHAVAERALLDGYRGPRPPHAWLIGGPPGIGKATLAYRMARFVLAHPDPKAPDVQRATSLALADDHSVTRKIAAQAHSDLMVLERTLGDTGKLRQDIRVEDVRRSVGFFGSTAGEGGWRVAIVDAVDDLNTAGANALLKALEEPPPRAMFLLVSHAPGRVLATIRSRSRALALRPLDLVDVAKAVTAVSGRDAGDPALLAAAQAAEGSVTRALALLDGAALAVRQRVTNLLEALPQVDARALHLLGEELGGTDLRAFTAFVDAVNAWLSGRLTMGAPDTARLAKVAETFDTVNREARTVEAFNLDRKPFVFATFGLLAESARR
ncbi:MAG: polymerase subunit delta [Xanthobacteraceae bacterium]|jgi:DNA polymerase-3 subunit delta'|nr:polymerase subunit delta [Xanthobacteraceae bacterium]